MHKSWEMIVLEIARFEKGQTKHNNGNPKSIDTEDRVRGGIYKSLSDGSEGGWTCPAMDDSMSPFLFRSLPGCRREYVIKYSR